MADKELLQEIEAVTEEQIASVESELREETMGMVVGKPIADTYFKKLATLYFLDLWNNPEKSPEEFFGSKSQTLDEMVQSKLAEFYGLFVSEEEWASHEVFLWICSGWRVYKVRHDIHNDPTKEKIGLLN